jgi:NADH dehydrogenase FAD-containing subunit
MSTDSVMELTRYPESSSMNAAVYRADERTARKPEGRESSFLDTIVGRRGSLRAILSQVEAVAGTNTPKAAKQRLENLGVEVRLGHSVDQIDADGIVVAGERIASKTVIWTAGVAPSPTGKWLNVETDRAGRVRIQKDLTVPGHPEIFVVGDTASLDQNGKPLPGVAQVAIQQGRYAGKLIHNRVVGSPAPGPFSYFDKGSMAVVGKGFAVLQTGKVQVSGFLAWLTWAAVHLQFLATSSLRLSVFLQWVWTYVTGQRGDRLIVNHHGAEYAKAAADASIKPAFAGR